MGRPAARERSTASSSIFVAGPRSPRRRFAYPALHAANGQAVARLVRLGAPKRILGDRDGLVESAALGQRRREEAERGDREQHDPVEARTRALVAQVGGEALEALAGLPAVPPRVVNQRETEPGFALEIDVAGRRGSLDGALAELDRARVVAAGEEVGAQIAEHAGQASRVAALGGQALGRLQVGEHALVLAEREQRVAQAQAQIDGLLDRARAARQVIQGVDGLLEIGRRLRERPPRRWPGSPPA